MKDFFGIDINTVIGILAIIVDILIHYAESK